jgi:hypothetical protein
VSAEGEITWRLGRIESDPGLEPLPVAIDDADQGYWRITDLRGEKSYCVVCLFRQRVENVERLQFSESGVFIEGERGGDIFILGVLTMIGSNSGRLKHLG